MCSRNTPSSVASGRSIAARDFQKILDICLQLDAAAAIARWRTCTRHREIVVIAIFHRLERDTASFNSAAH